MTVNANDYCWGKVLDEKIERTVANGLESSEAFVQMPAPVLAGS
jgi:hypothetical protein